MTIFHFSLDDGFVPYQSSTNYHDRKPFRACNLREPGAFSYGVFEVGTCESGARHKVDVLLGIEAHLLQKWHQLLLTLLIPVRA